MSATDQKVREVLAWLERRGTKKNRDGMARYAIVAEKVFGVSVADLQQLGKRARAGPRPRRSRSGTRAGTRRGC